MGSFAYMLGSESQEAPRRNGPVVGRDRVFRVVRGQVPPLWLALFESGDLRWGKAPGEAGRWVPYFNASQEKCATVYRRRRPWLRRVLRHHGKAVEAWEGYIRFLDAPYLKLEFDGVVTASEDFCDTLVTSACDLFDGAPEADLAPLLHLAGEWSYSGTNGALVWRAANTHWVAGDADLMGRPKRSWPWIPWPW